MLINFTNTKTEDVTVRLYNGVEVTIGVICGDLVISVPKQCTVTQVKTDEGNPDLIVRPNSLTELLGL